MGRHSAASPTEPSTPATSARAHPARPVAQEVEFSMVPWPQQPPSASGASTWTPAHRPIPPLVRDPAERRPPAPAARTAEPGPARVKPPEHRPVRAVGTPATGATPVQLPNVQAPSLSTGPIPTAPAPRASRRVRVALGLGALAVTASVVVQVVASR